MSNAISQVGAFVNRKFSINRNTGQPRIRRFSVAEPSGANTGEYSITTTTPKMGTRRGTSRRLACFGFLAVLAKQTLQMSPQFLDELIWHGKHIMANHIHLQRRAPRSTGSSVLLTSRQPHQRTEYSTRQLNNLVTEVTLLTLASTPPVLLPV